MIGLDVGKIGHHACALDPDGNRVIDRPIVQDAADLRGLFTGLQERGEVLLVVDQTNTIGALLIAVARDVGCTVACLPGLAMRRAAGLCADRAKTDARDAFIIADTARTVPRTLRAADRVNEVLSALMVVSGFDVDLAHETTGARTGSGPCPLRSTLPWSGSSPAAASPRRWAWTCWGSSVGPTDCMTKAEEW